MNNCDYCACKDYINTLCTDCADRFCLGTCGSIAPTNHEEPSVCPQCHKIHAYTYFETSFSSPNEQVSV